jgi:hypothetical protein
MRAMLRISICLNLALLGSLALVLASRQEETSIRVPVLSETKPPTAPSAHAAPTFSSAAPKPFRWSQLESAKDYRTYIANLRAIGCPEATIEDIVRGDATRAFCWERHQLGLSGAGTGPWSRALESELVEGLLNEQQTAAVSAAQEPDNPTEESSGEVAQTTAPSQSAGTGAPSYPLFLQDVNWSALGFSAEQQAAIAQVRQQFESEIRGSNQNPSGAADPNPIAQNPNAGLANPNPNATDSAALTQWQQALNIAYNQLHDALGAQGYETYLQQQYYNWYQPQAVAAYAKGEHLTINPEAFTRSFLIPQ